MIGERKERVVRWEIEPQITGGLLVNKVSGHQTLDEKVEKTVVVVFSRNYHDAMIALNESITSHYNTQEDS